MQTLRRKADISDAAADTGSAARVRSDRTATADPRWLKLGLAAILGVAAGTMLFSTEAQGRAGTRTPTRNREEV